MLDLWIVKYYIGLVNLNEFIRSQINWDNFWLWCKVGLTIAQTRAQLELIPGLLAGLFLLSPGAPVNNCRWASIQWTWDQ